MIFPRESGVLLHPISLPGPYGVGEIGPHARIFVEVLREMGQRLWQVLPLGPADSAYSPYQSPSTFAGNPLMISLDDLAALDLLDASDLADYPTGDPHAIDYERLIPARQGLLALAAGRFAERADGALRQACADWQSEHGPVWLHDFALFSAIKREQEDKAWTNWPAPLTRREPAALAEAAERLSEDIDRVKIEQFLFMHQWMALRDCCRGAGVKIVGDIPIFVAHDSAEVWANPELFQLDERGEPTVIAGVPPDYFSKTGQRWGNPLYRWDVMADNGFEWWKKRLRHVLSLADMVRIDHFRGFQDYWEIPADEETAINGRWRPGPGDALFHAFREALGDELPIIAEDLGDITEEVEALRDRLELPGMKILQFAFDGDPENKFLPHNFTPNCVVYTGTHDNNTAVGWFQGDAARTPEEIERDRHNARAYLGVDGSEINWNLIEAAWRSPANTAIAPMQDLLGLDGSARLNTPGQKDGNWRWRFEWEALTPDIKQRLRRLTEETGRI